jgi:hypothetical protein
VHVELVDRLGVDAQARDVAADLDDPDVASGRGEGEVVDVAVEVGVVDVAVDEDAVDLAGGREVAGQVTLGVDQRDLTGLNAVGTDVATGEEAAATALLLCNVTQDVRITGSQ